MAIESRGDGYNPPLERTPAAVYLFCEVFNRFKRFANQETGEPMGKMVKQIDSAADVYQRFVSSSTRPGEIDRLALFGYRTGVLEREIVKPLVLYLLDPQQQPIPTAQFHKALDVVESWMVRRMLVRATTKSYGQVIRS